jgi:hypothetical protein
MRVRTLRAFGLLLLAGFATAAQQTPEPERVQLELYYRPAEWVMSPNVTDTAGPGGASVTRSVFLSLVQAVDPHTHKPFVPISKEFECDPEDLRHSFRLEKSEFLLGEPVVVEHRIELDGPGTWEWFAGGNYRARGRDDNFSFVLRRADGMLVPDPYPPLDGMFIGGGLGSFQEIKRGKPFSEWYGLQRYAAINEPGEYDLYCVGGYKQRVFGEREAMQAALPDRVARDHYINENKQLIDRLTGLPSKRYEVLLSIYNIPGEPSPLAGALPPEVSTYSGEHATPGVMPDVTPDLGVVAHFRIRIRRGTEEERRQMAERWLETFNAPGKGQLLARSYKTALRDAIWFSWQDDFFPHVASWVERTRRDEALLPLEGLALRPDKAAFDLLVKAPVPQVVNAFYHLNRERVADAVPLCIEWLTHTDAQVRAMAESRLTTWTGQGFERTWEGYHYQRPTLEEGRRMQPLWRAWWEKNKAGFNPRRRCGLPCPEDQKTLPEADRL